MPVADGRRDGGAHDRGRREVEEGGPDHGQARRQHTRRDDRRDGVRGVVEAVDVVENQRDDDDEADGAEQQAQRESPVLDDDAFDDVRDVFAAVGDALEVVVELPSTS